MDGDRPMADRRDLLESKIQNIIYEAVIYGRYNSHKTIWELECEGIGEYFERLHELLVSYFDGEASDVGAQDEASEARAVGDSIRSKTYLKGTGIQTCVFDDLDSDLCQSIMNKRSEQISEAAKKALLDYSDSLFNGCIETVETMDDGTIDVRTRYF